MAAKEQCRSSFLCALLVGALGVIGLWIPAAGEAKPPATEEYVLEIPGVAGSERVGDIEDAGKVVGSGGVVGEGNVGGAGAIGEFLLSPVGLLVLAPAALVGGVAIRSRTRG